MCTLVEVKTDSIECSVHDVLRIAIWMVKMSNVHTSIIANHRHVVVIANVPRITGWKLWVVAFDVFNHSINLITNRHEARPLLR